MVNSGLGGGTGGRSEFGNQTELQLGVGAGGLCSSVGEASQSVRDCEDVHDGAGAGETGIEAVSTDLLDDILIPLCRLAADSDVKESRHVATPNRTLLFLLRSIVSSH